MAVCRCENHAPETVVSYISNSGQARVSESAEVGAVLGIVHVRDVDGDSVKCSTNDTYFVLDRLTAGIYKIQLNTVLDRERQATYDVEITCSDDGTPVMSSRVETTVYVNDVNDHAPIFQVESYTVAAREDNPPGTQILTVAAFDMDEGENGRIVYTLRDRSAPFRIDSSTGRLFLTSLLDKEMTSSYHLEVIATDNGAPTRQARVSVTVTVSDVNDNPPVFGQSHYSASLVEGSPIGETVVKVTAMDLDANENAVVTYALSRPSQYVRVDPDSGFIFLVKSLPRDLTQIDVSVRASDRGRPQLTTETSVTIRISRRPTTEGKTITTGPGERYEN